MTVKGQLLYCNTVMLTAVAFCTLSLVVVVKTSCFVNYLSK